MAKHPEDPGTIEAFPETAKRKKRADRAMTNAERQAAFRSRWHRVEAALDESTMARLLEIQKRLGGTRADALLYALAKVKLPALR